MAIPDNIPEDVGNPTIPDNTPEIPVVSFEQLAIIKAQRKADREAAKNGRLGIVVPPKVEPIITAPPPRPVKVIPVPLIQKIKAAQLEARKAHDTDRSALLTTLIGEAEMIGKNNGNRESNDIEVVATIKKFIKANNDNIDLINDNNSTMVVNAIRDNQLLADYLPAQLSNDMMRSFVLRIIKDEQEVRMNMMGVIMKKLNAKYPGQIDGKAASVIVRTVLQENISG